MLRLLFALCMQLVSAGNFTDIICEANVPTVCEIVEEGMMIDHFGEFSCNACQSTNSASSRSGGGVITSGEASSSLSSYTSKGSTNGDSSEAISYNDDAVGSVYGECAQDVAVTSCADLETMMGVDRGSCTVYIANNITCDAAITVASGQEVTVSGRLGGKYFWISVVSPFSTPSAEEVSLGASLFVVEDGGQLTLQNLGFSNEALTNVRVVHNYGSLYVSGCILEGLKPAGALTSRDDYGGAVRSFLSVGGVLLELSLLPLPFGEDLADVCMDDVKPGHTTHRSPVSVGVGILHLSAQCARSPSSRFGLFCPLPATTLPSQVSANRRRLHFCSNKAYRCALYSVDDHVCPETTASDHV